MTISIDNGTTTVQNRVYAPNGSTALDAMATLAAHGELTYILADLDMPYPYMINGVYNVNVGENLTYWNLYINNVYAEVGVAELMMHDGDVVEWRYLPFP